MVTNAWWLMLYDLQYTHNTPPFPPSSVVVHPPPFSPTLSLIPPFSNAYPHSPHTHCLLTLLQVLPCLLSNNRVLSSTAQRKVDAPELHGIPWHQDGTLRETVWGWVWGTTIRRAMGPKTNGERLQMQEEGKK
jgi:hypothetical protein